MKRFFAWFVPPTHGGGGGCVITVLFVSGIAALPVLAAVFPGSPG